MSDIVLVYPKTGMDIGSTVAPPHSLLAVAAPLHEDGYKVKIIDQRISQDWRKRLLKELGEGPICVGISAMTGTQIRFALEIAEFVRFYSFAPIVWGGPHPTLLPTQTLESGYADIVCIGEADETFPELVSAIANKRGLTNVDGIAYRNDNETIITKPKSLPDVNKLLPTPWSLVNVENYIHPDIYLKKSPRTLDIGQTSRGCPFMCGFCSSASIRQRRWRPITADKAIGMIVDATRGFKLSGVWLRDDEFFVNSERAAEIAKGIIPLGIKWYTSGTRVDTFNRLTEEQTKLVKRSGAYVLKFGAESGSNRILKLMSKGITKEETLEANLKAKRHGIIPAFALMLGFPTETFSEMNETIDMAKQIRKDNPQAQLETMAMYTALPGTPMWNMALEYGLKPPERLEEWADWNFDEYDSEGKRIPWFNSKERQAIGNLCYISMLSNAIPNVLDSLENGALSRLLKVGYALPHKYYQWRFFGKHYEHSLELGVVRQLRNRLFYNSHRILR